MRRAILCTVILFYSLFLSSIKAQVTQFPQVYYNDGSLNLKQYIRPDPNQSSPYIDQLYPSWNIGGESINTTGGDPDYKNWVRVCLPSTSGTLTYGYMACSETMARIHESNSYAVVTTNNLNIRPCAGCTTQWVTLGGLNAQFGMGSIVALTGTTQPGWHEVYLTVFCSQSKGWLSDTWLNIPSSQNYYVVGGRVCDDVSTCNTAGNIDAATVTLGSLGSTFSSHGFYQYKLAVNWSGTITCTHPSYSTSIPPLYNYTAISHDYTKNFILSNSFAPIAITNPATNVLNTSAKLNGTVNANNYSTTVTFEYGLTTSYGSTISGIPSTVTGTANTAIYANLTSLASGTIYHFRIKAVNFYGTSYGSDLTFTTTGTPEPIQVTDKDIPPWQREGDDFEGSVTVLTNPQNASWFLRVKVYNIKTNGLITIIDYPQITLATQHFFRTDPLIYANAFKDRRFDFFAVLAITSEEKLAGIMKIIEPRWNYKNVIYQNNNSPLLIPVKYNSTTPANQIELERTGNVAATLIANAIPWPKGKHIGTFPVGNDGYCEIPGIEMKILAPGDFKAITYSNSVPIDVQFFDLTKFGRVFENGNSDTIVVGIGGLFNEMDESARELSKCSTACEDFSFSILKALHESPSHFDVWYIAQGNANTIKRNAFDIGKALDTIKSLNPSVEKFNIVSHSKGGLDTRAFLQDLSQPYSNETPNSSYSSSKVFNKIKSVLFLGTPHQGALLAFLFKNVNIAGLGGLSIVDIYPGAKDLVPHSSILNDLNSGVLPQTICYLNLAGYESYKVSNNILNPFSIFFPTQLTLTPQINNLGDGLVSIFSNDYLRSKPRVKQLYQHSYSFMSHFHQNEITYLQQSDQSYNNCPPSTYSNNLEKIKAFFTSSNPCDPSLPFSSCSRPIFSPISINLFGSLLPGSRIFLKPKDDSVFYFLGISNDYSSFSGTIIPSIVYKDSLFFVAPDYENLKISIDSNILQSSKVVASMMKSHLNTTNVKHTSLSLVNELPITSNNQTYIEVKGQNVLKYEVNNPFNQDSIFTPLILSDNKFLAQLDTGLNSILVRFCGSIDTLTLSKDIYFLPENLMTNYTYKLILNSGNNKNYYLYVNNQFFKRISLSIDTIPLLNGYNFINFSKLGYRDSLIIIDSSRVLNTSQVLFPVSYSSLSDTNTFNFFTSGKIQYWKSVTLLDSLLQNIISLKQLDDNFSSYGFIPKSRKFDFRHLNSNWSGIRFAAILDQIENLSTDSIYLMKIINDTSFTKIYFDSSGLVAGYDSAVQKLSYNYIDFNGGTAAKEALVIMKKLAPIVKNIPSLTININDKVKLPLSFFFEDPDSIHNEMTFRVGYAPPQLTVQIVNDSVIITPSNCWYGNTSFTIQARHDSIWRNASDSVHVMPSVVPTITASGPTTFCQGNSVTLTSSFAGSYFWNTGDTTRTITVSSSGNYYVSINDTASGCPVSSVPVSVTVNPIFPVDITIAASSNPVCSGTSVTFTATATNGGTSPLYQWKINGNISGSNASTLTYNPGSGDQISCLLTSSVPCPSVIPALSNTLTMIVLAYPVVTLPRCFDTITTLTAQPIKLKGGLPLSGTYSGPGVISDVFYPSVAGIGTHSITYKYSNLELCESNASKTITVINPPLFACGNIFNDIRDGNSYPTVQIGSQCWMASNLNYGSMILSQQNQRDNCISEKYCQNNQLANCNLHRTHYQWDELMLYDDSPAKQGMCPPGWHVPSEIEWTTLFGNFSGNAFAGDSLKVSGSSGFNALFFGARHLNVQWDYNDFAAFFWTSTAHGPYKAWAYSIDEYDPSVSYYPSSRINAFSIRCIKDACSSVPVAPAPGQNPPFQTQIIWNWHKVPGVLGYKWNILNDYSTAIDVGGDTIKTETGLSCDSNYTRYIWAYNGCGASAASNLNQQTTACFQCGQPFTDTRDNRTYNTVQIGTQCWMKENLNNGTRIDIPVNQTNNDTIEKYCYDNLESNCDTYGGLYRWDEMMNYTTSSNSIPSGRSGICPLGWHVPSGNEWCQLEFTLDTTLTNCYPFGWIGSNGGGQMKEVGFIHWANPNTGATNSSGFTALPGGSAFGNSFQNNYFGWFWTSYENGSLNAFWIRLDYNNENSYYGDSKKQYGYSVRCVKY